jgi:hypothetical protein
VKKEKSTHNNDLLVSSEKVSRSLILKSGYTVESVEENLSDVLHIMASDGKLCLRIVLTPEGPVVELQSVSLVISAEKDIRLRADSLEIETKKDLSIKAGGDIVQYAEGNIETEAFAQRILARRGNIAVKANDDVMIDGERIRLNSPRPFDVKTLKKDGE